MQKSILGNRVIPNDLLKIGWVRYGNYETGFTESKFRLNPYDINVDDYDLHSYGSIIVRVCKVQENEHGIELTLERLTLERLIPNNENSCEYCHTKHKNYNPFIVLTCQATDIVLTCQATDMLFKPAYDDLVINLLQNINTSYYTKKPINIDDVLFKLSSPRCTDSWRKLQQQAHIQCNRENSEENNESK